MAVTLDRYNGNAGGDAFGLRYSSLYQKLAFSFQPSQTGYVHEMHLFVARYLGYNPGGDFWCSVYDNNSGNPGTQIGSISNKITANTTNIPATSFTSPTEVTFTFTSSIPITASTTYWVVIEADWAYTATNFFSVAASTTKDTTNAPNQSGVYLYNGTSWSLGSASRWFLFEQYYDTSPPGGGGTSTNSDRGAEVTGSQSTSNTRDAETTGHDTTSSDRSAEITGQSLTNTSDTRPGEILAGDGAWVEHFTTTTYKDNVNTTASWTTDGTAEMSTS